MKIAFYTLGCKVNQYETQAMKESFVKEGHEMVSPEEKADAYIINTCTVTGLSDRKSRQFIRRGKKLNEKAIIAVVGCYAQVSPEEVEKIEDVDIIVGTNEKSHLLEYIETFSEKAKKVVKVKAYEALKEYEELEISHMDTKTRAFVKIQEGCNQFCSYCIIPYARGNVRSRTVENTLKEVESLIDRGIKEIVLTGINTALYGRENQNDSNMDLNGLIKAIETLSAQKGAELRIRLSSLEPTVVNGDYVEKLIKNKHLCHHLHLSLQSGSDPILKAMNRHYDFKTYETIINTGKAIDPNFGFTTDIIVGFPGESEADFNASLEALRKIDFAKVHVFKYSKRAGTKAAEMKNEVSPSMKKMRSQQLIIEGEASAKRFMLGNIGTIRSVLFEDFDPEQKLLSGHTDNYIKVYYSTENPEFLNKVVDMKIDSLYNEGVKVKLSE